MGLFAVFNNYTFKAARLLKYWDSPEDTEVC
jgi:hypothetical protein